MTGRDYYNVLEKRIALLIKCDIDRSSKKSVLTRATSTGRPVRFYTCASQFWIDMAFFFYFLN